MPLNSDGWDMPRRAPFFTRVVWRKRNREFSYRKWFQD